MGRKLFPVLSPGRLIASIAVFGALLACAPATAAAADTWAGVWKSDFGRMTLSASGSGSYEGFNPGTVSGNVTGNVNQGTWNQPGTPPKSGTFKFTLSTGGLSFTGDWAYDAGGCGTACGWNGTCIEGACLQNGTPTGCFKSIFRVEGPGPCAPLATSPTVRPKLGENTSYIAPLPGKVAAIPTPELGRKAKTAVVDIGTASESGTTGAAPPVVGVLTRAEQEDKRNRHAFKALQLCFLLSLVGNAAEGHRTFSRCAATVIKILERYDKIQATKGISAQAAQTPACRSVKPARRGKRLRAALRIRCTATATGLHVTFRRLPGRPSLRSLFGRKSRVLVGRSRFDAPVAFGDRVNVLWRSQNR